MNIIQSTLNKVKEKIISFPRQGKLSLAIDWLLIILFIAGLIWFSDPFPRQIILGIVAILVFRFAHRIPLLRRLWIGFFGERQFWDWMTLLCAPLILSILGVSISSSINKNQADLSIISDRLAISNEYYKQTSSLILREDFQKIVKVKKTNKNKFIEDKKENCDPERDNTLTSIGYTKTMATLRSLSKLRTSDEEFTPLKRGIIQLLYYSGLINRYSPVISLQKADLSETDLSDIDLSGSCFDSINFSGSNLNKTILSNSNLMRSNFKNSKLRFAKLQEANIINSDLSNSNMQKSDLLNANLQGSKLVKADLRGANLFGVKLEGADLSEADLRGANLMGVSIDSKTNFKDSIYNDKSLNNTEEVIFKKKLLAYFSFLKNIFRIEDFIPEEVILEPTKFEPIYCTKCISKTSLDKNNLSTIKRDVKTSEIMEVKKMLRKDNP